MSFYFCFIFQTISNQKEFSCPINFILFSFNPSYLPPSSNPFQLICPQPLVNSSLSVSFIRSCPSQLIRPTILLYILAHLSHHPPIHPSSYVPPSSCPSQLIRPTILAHSSYILLSILAHPSHHPSSSVPPSSYPPVHPSSSVPPSAAPQISL